MGKRSTGRRLAMQLLYQAEVRDMDVDQFAEDFLVHAETLEETKTWAFQLSTLAWEARGEADSVIQKYSVGWDLDRINVVDKCIIRLAYYEIRHTSTPVRVVLNEAIEMAKMYSTEESPKFINGVLGHFVRSETQPSEPVFQGPNSPN